MTSKYVFCFVDKGTPIYDLYARPVLGRHTALVTSMFFLSLSTDQLDQIAQQHQQELQTFIKDQEQKQQKIRGSLEEKLAMRRQRRALQNLEEAQKNALIATE